MMTPRTATHPATEPGAGTTGWTRVAARAAHPASRSDDQPWLWSIAAGLAATVGPSADCDTHTAGGPPHTIHGSARGALLLSTPAYEAWHVAWPAGLPTEVTGTLRVESFCVVEGGLRLVDRTAAVPTERRYGPGTGTVLDSPHAVLIADQPVTSAVHVVLWGDSGDGPLPWTPTAGDGAAGGVSMPPGGTGPIGTMSGCLWRIHRSL